MKKKRWEGAKRVVRKKRPDLVGDSYQADRTDLKRVREIADEWGWSKARVLRYATKLVIGLRAAQIAGRKTVTFETERRL